MNAQANHKISFANSNEFERLYIDLRTYEKRMYSDEEVLWLPDVDEDHVHKHEWKVRKASCNRLTKYLLHKKKPLRILEVGCGNGWLSYHLSQIPLSDVVGLDVNLPELQQAARVFAATPNINFIHGDLDDIKDQKFDVIVFAASVQYFHSFSDIMKSALEHLTEEGEIHIIDSHFYEEKEVAYARQRSREYFSVKGFNKMGDFYFHHTLKELKEFNAEILHDPNSFISRILKRKSRFHWVCIKK